MWRSVRWTQPTPHWGARPNVNSRPWAALATFPELRMCVSTTGDANLAMTFRTRSPHDMLRVERKLGMHLPWLRLRDNAITLRTPKRMGWLLDGAGRATGTVIPPTALAAC
jgi:hypothetical protein